MNDGINAATPAGIEVTKTATCACCLRKVTACICSKCFLPARCDCICSDDVTVAPHSQITCDILNSVLCYSYFCCTPKHCDQCRTRKRNGLIERHQARWAEGACTATKRTNNARCSIQQDCRSRGCGWWLCSGKLASSALTVLVLCARVV